MFMCVYLECMYVCACVCVCVYLVTYMCEPRGRNLIATVDKILGTPNRMDSGPCSQPSLSR